MQVDEERSKQAEAWCRAMSLSRMVDYGMPRDLAELAHRMVKEGAAWDAVLEDLGREQEETREPRKIPRAHATSGTPPQQAWSSPRWLSIPIAIVSGPSIER